MRTYWNSSATRRAATHFQRNRNEPREPSFVLRSVVVVVLGIAFLSLAFRFGSLSIVRSTNDPPIEVATTVGDSPLSIKKHVLPVVVPFSATVLRAVSEKLVSVATARNDSLSALLHSARLQATLERTEIEWIKRNDAGQIVQLSLGGHLERTWRGIETRRDTDGRRLEHRDQLLAALAQADVSLKCEFNMQEDGQRISVGAPNVRDMLQTSLHEFHLKQSELAWTAIAYALYLPPQLYWLNRFGERYDFDALSNELLGRRLSSESCGGVHLMIAMTVLARVDENENILTPKTRHRVHEYLAMRVRDAVSSQLPDGSWPMVWWTEESVRDGPPLLASIHALDQKVTITGHILEWIHTLPPDLQPPPESVRSAVLWITPVLIGKAGHFDETDICPCTHAIIAVQECLEASTKLASESPH